MGKGDKKTRRGKIILGTHGVRRPRKKSDKPEIIPALLNQQGQEKTDSEMQQASETNVRQPRVKEATEEKAVKPASKAAEPKPVRNKKLIDEGKAAESEPSPVKAKKA